MRVIFLAETFCDPWNLRRGLGFLAKLRDKTRENILWASTVFNLERVGGAPEGQVELSTTSASPAEGRVTRTLDQESALIDRVCAGEKQLFHELIQPYERSVFIAANAVVQNEADAEEAAQEAFLKAFTHLCPFRKEAKSSTWLTQIAVNEAPINRRQASK